MNHFVLIIITFIGRKYLKTVDTKPDICFRYNRFFGKHSFAQTFMLEENNNFR